MKGNNNIHLVYFSGSGNAEPAWTLGGKTAISLSVHNIAGAIQHLSQNSNADWICFWDYSLGQPDTDLIQELTMQPVDVWHSGLKLGTGSLPDVLNYVHPTWMYNRNGHVDVAHSSFRLSARCCLIRLDVIKKGGFPSSAYTSVDMFGIALGYRLIKQGAIMRYHPDLISTTISGTNAPELDEWIFAREFFTKKWQLWTLLNRPGFFNNLKAWIKTIAVKSSSLDPCIHSSNANAPTPSYETVSVLAPTLNRYSYLEAELEQLSRQTIPAYEVLITDQTDIKDRVDLDFSKYPGLTVRYFPQNEKGQCLAWNKLLEEAKGDYVLFLGDDADDIKPAFIEKLLATMQRFNCDMVASNVIEIGMPPKPANHHYYMSDTFPITLIKKDVVERAGFMDMFFNKNIRADHDLAMRCHLNGALMIFDSSAIILHHRAPAGGLRTHNARVITNHISKNSISKFVIPTSSEIYLVKKYYNPVQYSNYIRIRFFNLLNINGNIFKKCARLLYLLYKLPETRKKYLANLSAAEAALKKVNENRKVESTAGY